MVALERISTDPSITHKNSRTQFVDSAILSSFILSYSSVRCTPFRRHSIGSSTIEDNYLLYSGFPPRRTSLDLQKRLYSLIPLIFPHELHAVRQPYLRSLLLPSSQVLPLTRPLSYFVFLPLSEQDTLGDLIPPISLRRVIVHGESAPEPD